MRRPEWETQTKKTVAAPDTPQLGRDEFRVGGGPWGGGGLVAGPSSGDSLNASMLPRLRIAAQLAVGARSRCCWGDATITVQWSKGIDVAWRTGHQGLPTAPPAWGHVRKIHAITALHGPAVAEGRGGVALRAGSRRPGAKTKKA